MKTNYGEILKRAIESRGYKQKDVAAKMKEKPQNLSNWLNRNDLTVSNFIKICEAIEINPAELLTSDIVTKKPESDIDPRWIPIIKQIETIGPGLQAAIMEVMLTTIKAVKNERKKQD